MNENYRQETIRNFKQILANVHRKRHTYTDNSWLQTELLAMLDCVNQERLKQGLPYVDINVISRADRLAAGHIDYADKFVLYCSEIALGLQQSFWQSKPYQ